MRLLTRDAPGRVRPTGVLRRARHSERARQLAVAGGVVACSLVLGLWVGRPVAIRASLSAVAVTTMVVVGIARPRHLLYVLIAWLAVLGLVRRLVDAASPAGSLDPFLLVLPAALGVMLIASARAGAFRGASGLTKAVAAFTIILTLGAVNPMQGGLSTGAAGLFLTVAPMLAFWVGRSICDDRTLRGAFRLIGVLALGAAVYGLIQTFHGFPSWDRTWIARATADYAALVISGVVRPFASFSASTEYAYFLAIGLAARIAFALDGVGKLAVAIPGIGLLAVAILYASARTVVVFAVVGIGVALAARARLRMGPAVVVGIAFLAGLFALASHFGGSTANTSGPGALVAHQVQGLANPLDPSTSTTSIHISAFVDGLRSAVSHPLGTGTGSISYAATKFGGNAAGTELDPSNAAVAVGIPGLLAYLAVLLLGLPRAYRLASQRGDALSAIAMAVLVITLFQWMNGGQYAVAFLPWLVLGWVDRRTRGGEEQAGWDNAEASAAGSAASLTR